jgi:hypothetical protein
VNDVMSVVSDIVQLVYTHQQEGRVSDVVGVVSDIVQIFESENYIQSVQRCGWWTSE